MPEHILYLVIAILTFYAAYQIRNKWKYYAVISPKRISFTKSVLGTLVLSFIIVWGFTAYVVFGILDEFENQFAIGLGMAMYFILGNLDMYVDAVIRSEIESD